MEADEEWKATRNRRRRTITAAVEATSQFAQAGGSAASAHAQREILQFWTREDGTELTQADIQADIEKREELRRLKLAQEKLREANRAARAAEERRATDELLRRKNHLTDPTAMQYAAERERIVLEADGLQSQGGGATAPSTVAPDAAGAAPTDKFAKHRTAIHGTRKKPGDLASFRLDSLRGQEKATTRTFAIIDQINKPPGTYGNPLPQSLFLIGPSGTGKGHCAKAIANETGCTLFMPGRGFFDGKNLDRLGALFGIAKETAELEKKPCLIFLDECDGLFSHRNDAKVNALKMIWEDKSDLQGVIVLCTTNNYKRLKDEGLTTRLCNVIEFDPLSAEALKEIVTRNFASMYDGNGHPLELSESDWEELTPLLKDMNAKTISEWCNNVASDVTCDYATRKTRHDNIIRLKDLKATSTGNAVLSSGSSSSRMSEDAISKVMEWINDTWVYEKSEVKGTEKEVVVALHDSILKSKDVCPDEILTLLGATDIPRLRIKKAELKIRQLIVKENLVICFQRAHPGCQFDDLDGKKRLCVERMSNVGKDGMLNQHEPYTVNPSPYGEWGIRGSDGEWKELPSKPKRTIRCGWVIENVQFRIDLAPGDKDRSTAPSTAPLSAEAIQNFRFHGWCTAARLARLLGVPAGESDHNRLVRLLITDDWQEVAALPGVRLPVMSVEKVEAATSIKKGLGYWGEEDRYLVTFARPFGFDHITFQKEGTVYDTDTFQSYAMPIDCFRGSYPEYPEEKLPA